MKRILAGLVVLAVATLAVAQDGHVHTNREVKALLPLPKEEGVFHFLIFGDRTGGPREGLKVLAQAVGDANLLGPDLVMTVGDLVPGYCPPEQWKKDMEEYKAIMAGLDVPWYPAAGNHDVYWFDKEAPRGQNEGLFEEYFGPLWYWFPHKNAAFVVLFTDEGDLKTGQKGYGRPELHQISPAQLAWIEKTLEETKEYDHVFFFMHHPRWISDFYRGSNWDKVHDLMVKAGNVTAVFAGHIHTMRYEGVKDGIEYLTLATTGGGIPFDVPGTGWLHHMNLVTVRKDRITMATIPVGAVVNPREMTPERLEELSALTALTPEVIGKELTVKVDGSCEGVLTAKLANPSSRPIEVNAQAGSGKGDWRCFPEHRHLKIGPKGSVELQFMLMREAQGFEEFSFPEIRLQVDFLGEARRVSMPEGSRVLQVWPESTPDEVLEAKENRCLVLDGESALMVPASRVGLPQGPFTAEARVAPHELDGQHAIVGKTEQSEFLLLLEDGKPTFMLHQGDGYVIARAEEPVKVDEWTHVAAVWDVTEMRLYVDGKLVARQDATGQRTENEMPLYIGAEPLRDKSPGFNFVGKIDEVRLSKVARYTDESFTLKKRYEGDAATLLLLHMDAHLGPFVPDHSPRATRVREVGEVRWDVVPADRASGAGE